MENIKARLFTNIKKRLAGLKNVRLLVVLGFAGMILILLSEFLPEKNKAENREGSDYSVSEYADQMERQVEEILGKIEGVGKVSVMLTVEGTEEYIYAQESKESISSGAENSSQQLESKYIFVQKNGDKDALVKKVINPRISGVVVVCEGGDDSSTREKIYNAVSVSLGIASNRIYVAGSKNT